MVEKFFNLLLEEESKYKTKEEKNLMLVHKFTEFLGKLEDNQFDELKNKVFDYFNMKDHYSFLFYVHGVSNIAPEPPQKKTDYSLKNGHFGTAEKPNILDYYKKFDANLLSFIKGHLFLDSCMHNILKKSGKVDSVSKEFSGKVYQLSKQGLISEEFRKLLFSINKTRNKIAHELYYKLTFDEVFELVKLSAEAGVDYTDSTIYENKGLSEEWYGTEAILDELFPNIFCHLLYEHEDLFEKNEFCDFMG